MATRGVVYVHASPPAVCPHVEWALSGVLGTRVSLDWTAQPAQPGALRTECCWSGSVGTGSRLAAALRAWPMLRFEVTEDADAESDGERMQYVPGRGLHRSMVGANGDLVVGEQQLRALRSECTTAEQFVARIDGLLGAEWDADLEAYRHAGDGAPVTWLYEVG